MKLQLVTDNCFLYSTSHEVNFVIQLSNNINLVKTILSNYLNTIGICALLRMI